MGTHPIFESDFDCLTDREGKMIGYLLTLNLFFSNPVESVRYKDCGTVGIKIGAISVTPCPKEPCELHHGQSYRIDIDFEEDIEDELALEICGYLGPVCVPFPTNTPKQKVTPGKNTFTLSMPIEPAYPNIKVVGKFQLRGKSSEKMCFLLPLKIMPARETKLLEESILDQFDEIDMNIRKNVQSGSKKLKSFAKSIVQEFDENKL